jgi:hypothetical protein
MKIHTWPYQKLPLGPRAIAYYLCPLGHHHGQHIGSHEAKLAAQAQALPYESEWETRTRARSGGTMYHPSSSLLETCMARQLQPAGHAPKPSAPPTQQQTTAWAMWGAHQGAGRSAPLLPPHCPLALAHLQLSSSSSQPAAVHAQVSSTHCDVVLWHA